MFYIKKIAEGLNISEDKARIIFEYMAYFTDIRLSMATSEEIIESAIRTKNVLDHEGYI
jgi:hypothetical protein